MDFLGQQVRKQTTRGLDHFTIMKLQVMDPGWNWPFGVLFAKRFQLQTDISQDVFHLIIGVGFVTNNPGSGWQVKVEPEQTLSIVDTGRGQEKLDGLPGFSGHQMQFETIVEPLFGCLVAAIDFTLVKFCSRNAVVVTDHDRKGIDGIVAVGVQRFPVFRQQVEQGQEEWFDPMQATRKATFAQHPGHVTLAQQKAARLAEITAEIQRSNQCGCHYFSIAHLALAIFMMMKGFQYIVTQTKNGYNLGIHEYASLVGRFGRPPTVAGFSWIFYPR